MSSNHCVCSETRTNQFYTRYHETQTTDQEQASRLLLAQEVTNTRTCTRMIAEQINEDANCQKFKQQGGYAFFSITTLY